MLNCKTFSTNANVLFRLNFKGFSKKCKSFNLNIMLRDADLTYKHFGDRMQTEQRCEIPSLPEKTL